MRWFLVVLAVAGCSGNGGGKDDATCSLAASGSGAASWSFDGEPACLIPFGASSGIDMIFSPLSGDLMSFEARVDVVREGETGAFPATVSVRIRGGAEYRTARTCTVTLSEHVATGESDGFSRPFQTAGEGSCPDPAIEVGGAGAISVEPFEFRFPARW
ncbi:hypothetical protein BH11MYX3_BH11MYX3_15620 [soil metagenome]